MRERKAHEKDDARSSEEMKELVIESTSKELNQKSKESAICNCSCHKNISVKSSSDKPESPDIKIQLLDPSLKSRSAINHLMTKRITIAGGFLDIALFTTNCEQLKFVMELGEFHIYYDQVLALLVTSLVLQLLVGFTMFLLGCQVTQKNNGGTYSSFLNHATMGLVALITVINIFIGTFGPKGTVMARCLGAFAYPNTSGPIWLAYLNTTRDFMANDL